MGIFSNVRVGGGSVGGWVGTVVLWRAVVLRVGSCG